MTCCSLVPIKKVPHHSTVCYRHHASRSMLPRASKAAANATTSDGWPEALRERPTRICLVKSLLQSGGTSTRLTLCVSQKTHYE
jgi:hypothetical protein